ncbi:MAG: metallophosphoesterase [Eubacteriales bacterium]|nr:metallophosphoesterase [Eubacteriales bacterium]MDD4327897.1 metallophosphoesterase [Eubacteriales bacterium]
MAGWYTGVILGLISIILLFRGLYEPHKLEITHTVLGEGKDSLKLLLLSDIHAAYFYVPLVEIRKVISSGDLDMVVFAGDICNGQHDFDKGVEIIRQIKAFADDAGIPLYAVEGNHDPEEIAVSLRETGVIFPENSSDRIIANDGSLWHIIGLRDIRTAEPSYSTAVNADLSDARISSSPKVVLAHNPDAIYNVIDEMPEDSPDVFMLSGHFHGGQIWMPFGLEYKIMRNERMSREGYRKGPFEKDGIKGYISRGLGCVIVPLRFLSKPEAAVIELKSDSSGLL